MIRAVLVVWGFSRPSNLQIYCHCEPGSWALVTGASDGIGRAFAEELLSRGFNVLLHGRNPQKLEGIKDEVSKQYPKRSAETVVADASKYDDGFKALVEKARGLPGKLTVLVNIVGGVTTRPQYISHSEIPHDDIDTQLNVNIRFPTQLTRAMLPILRENGPSVILNCGSSEGVIGVPYIVTYTSSKAYIHTFSGALKAEMVAEGIDNVDVMGLLIGSVSTAGNTHKIAFTITSKECAAGSSDRVGSDDALVFPQWKHDFQTQSAQVLPEKLLRRMVAGQMRDRAEYEKETTYLSVASASCLS